MTGPDRYREVGDKKIVKIADPNFDAVNSFVKQVDNLKSSKLTSIKVRA